MVNYQDGKIYKIVCDDKDLVYIGSTCEPTLARRLTKHKSSYRDWLKDNSKKYMTSFKVLEKNNFDIILVESCPCNSKDELHKRERHYIETIQCVNKYVPGRTIKEYYGINKDKIKEYREANKDKIKEKNKEYYEANKDKKKEYDQANKDKINERRRLLRLEKKQEKIV